jgi:hypothetical protein
MDRGIASGVLCGFLADRGHIASEGRASRAYSGVLGNNTCHISPGDLCELEIDGADLYDLYDTFSDRNGSVHWDHWESFKDFLR